MSENRERAVGTVVTAGQLARTHDVLVRELASLRNRALSRCVEPAHITQVFRHRADRLGGGSSRPDETVLDRVRGASRIPPGCERDDGEYSVWW